MISGIYVVVGIAAAGICISVLCDNSRVLLPSDLLFSMDASHFLDVEKRGHKMGIDQASLTVTSGRNVSIWTQSEACWKCNLVQQTYPSQKASLKLDTTSAQIISVLDEEINKTLCGGQVTRQFVDQGNYSLLVTDTECTWTMMNNPSNSDLPVYVALAVLVGLTLLCIAAKLLYNRGLLSRLAVWMPAPDHFINSDLGSPLLPDDGSNVPNLQPTNRIQSVDTLRGISLVIMIFVNYGGGNYWYFQHSAWNGLTVADLVFPWFVFLMGTSLAISFPSALRRGAARGTLLFRVIRRTCILFFFGLVISNSGPNVAVSTLRIFGVLQRLALTYFVVAVFEVFCAIPADPHVHKWWRGIRELVPSFPIWLLAFAVSLVYLCLTFLLIVPGCPRGYLGPGGLHDGGQFENCTGGASGYVDRVILTQNHMYQNPTCKRVYNCSQPYDPEGIMGTLMSVLLCILGLQAGKIIITFQSPKGIVRRWIVWGVFTGIVAGALCEFKLEDGLIPINKNLWSLSYVLAMSSMAFLLLLLLYVIIDVYNLWNGAPFIYPGMNSIVIYICHEVFEEYFPLQFRVPDSHTAYLCKNIWGTVFWVCVAALMYHKKVFVAI